MVRKGRTVLTSGAFDILHPGHLLVLRHARKIAGPKGRVIVVIARDETIRRRKKRVPILDEKARREVVASIRYVDEAVLGYRPFSFKKIMRRFRPEVVLFGYDQTLVKRSFVEEARREGWRVEVATAPRLSRSRPLSTFSLIRRAALSYSALKRGSKRGDR